MNTKSLNFEFTDPGVSIEFKNNTGSNPLMPLVQASYSDNNSLEISANIFINAEASINKKDISVIQDAENKFIFFIIYTNDNNSNAAKTFFNYRIDFAVENINTENNHGEIVVYLKDTDPTLSRGTVTTVQHTSGDL